MNTLNLELRSRPLADGGVYTLYELVYCGNVVIRQISVIGPYDVQRWAEKQYIPVDLALRSVGMERSPLRDAVPRGTKHRLAGAGQSGLSDRSYPVREETAVRRGRPPIGGTAYDRDAVDFIDSVKEAA